jgi:crossover junction endodeoxyribonuclease RuvC
MRILGIDPGSTATGFGVVDWEAGRLRHVAHGTLRPRRGDAIAQRLHFLHDGVARVVRDHEPEVAVVEQVFVAVSPRSALVLGQARGAALAAIAAGGTPVVEYTPLRIKQSVTGSGRAAKRQVQTMVRRLLGLERLPASDAADALAAAICHAHAGRLAPLASPAPRPRSRGRGLRVRRAL